MVKVVVGVEHDGGALDARTRRPSQRCRQHAPHIAVGTPVKHHLVADAARPGAAAKASEPTIVDVAADRVGDENAAQVGSRRRAVWIAGRGVDNGAAKVGRTGGAPVDGLILQRDRTVKIGGKAGAAIRVVASVATAKTRRIMLISGPFVEFSCAPRSSGLPQCRPTKWPDRLRGD
jgi:hypothetical protein